MRIIDSPGIYYKERVKDFSCNSSYVEKTERITKFNAQAANYSHPTMVIVTEWEEFGSQVGFTIIFFPEILYFRVN